ncbi:MAG TPA: hypothetical protein VIO11_01045 [Candidatus Methanoperedens sp.]
MRVNLLDLRSRIYAWFTNSDEMEKAIVISIIVGIIIAAFLVFNIKEERYSSLYIYPDSYTNYPESNMLSFKYGVKSYEKVKTNYELEVFVSDKSVDKKQFEIEPGGLHEDLEILKVSDLKLPGTVKLQLKSPFNTYDVHYWLKKVEETPTAPAIAPRVTSPDIPIETPEVSPTQTPVLFPNVTSTPSLTPTPSSTPSLTPTISPVSTPTAPVLTPTPSVVSNFTFVKLNRNFYPNPVSISVGTEVMWRNEDLYDRKYTLVSKEGLFTESINIDKRFSYKFTAPGTYRFYIKEIEGVEGIVIVS